MKVDEFSSEIWFTNVLCPIIRSADNTQDPEEDEQQLGRVKDWIKDRHLDTVELTDVLSNFPDISVVRASKFSSSSSFFWVFWQKLYQLD